MRSFMLLCVFFAVLAGLAYAQDLCSQFDNCEDCISGKYENDNITVTYDCYWCSHPSGNDNSSVKCLGLNTTSDVPVSGVDCPNLKFYVTTCKLSVLAILILIILACFLCLAIPCCICVTICCCCICGCGSIGAISSRKARRYESLN